MRDKYNSNYKIRKNERIKVNLKLILNEERVSVASFYDITLTTKTPPLYNKILTISEDNSPKLAYRP